MDAVYTYDAAGRMASIYTGDSTGQTFDGDGRRMKTSECTFNEETRQWDCVDKYYIRSSVLGGEVISEIDA